MKQKLGKELKKGDIIEFWFGRDRTISLSPYTGPLSYLWDKDGGAKLAELALNKVGITIEPNMVYDVFGSLDEE